MPRPVLRLSLPWLLILSLLAGTGPATAAAKPAGLSDPKEISGLKYRLVGPF